MDGRTFDDMVKALAAGASRRRVLAGFAGAALGAIGLSGVRAAQQTSNCAAITCLTDSDCCENCGGICVPAGTPCSDDLCGDPGAVPCNQVLCGPDEYCCNESCSICAPIGGGCTEQFCGEPCGSVTCGVEEYCCNSSCSICAPIGGSCTEHACGEPCGVGVTCRPDEFCCNESCGICAPIGGACAQQFCGEECPGAGQPCDAADRCCAGFVCNQDGLCAAAPPPDGCETDADCRAGITDPCTGATCNPDGTCAVFIVDCVPGYVCCNNGQCCADPPCSEAGESCADNACCDGLTCEGSGRRERVCVATDGRPAPTAVPTATARPSGGSGRTPSTPGGTVVRLPNTGVGPETTGASGQLAGALALAAGAAALVARRLRSVAPNGGDDRA